MGTVACRAQTDRIAKAPTVGQNYRWISLWCLRIVLLTAHLLPQDSTGGRVGLGWCTMSIMSRENLLCACQWMNLGGWGEGSSYSLPRLAQWLLVGTVHHV